MKIVFTPDWFLGTDVIIEVFSFAVLILFFMLAYRNYKLSKNKNSLYLGAGFLLIAIAEISTIFTKVVLYYDSIFTQTVGKIIVTSQIIQSVDIFYYLGFFFHKLFTLFGLYIIYRLPLGEKLSKEFLLGTYFLVLSAVFSTSFYYLFHLTALGLLLLIINNYYEICRKNKSMNTKMLVISFGLLALSQIIFLLSRVGPFYAIGQFIQLVSYIILLALMIRILEHGRQKKKQSRNNL